MKPKHFHESNRTYVAPEGVSSEACVDLPTHVDAESGSIVSCWEMSSEEQSLLLQTGCVWLIVAAVGYRMPPVMLSLVPPSMPKCDPPIPMGDPITSLRVIIEALRIQLEEKMKQLETERVLRQHAWGVIKRIGKRVGWRDDENDAAWQERIIGLVDTRLEQSECDHRYEDHMGGGMQCMDCGHIIREGDHG